jgi:hypothetical protein
MWMSLIASSSETVWESGPEAAVASVWMLLNLCGIYLQTGFMFHASRIEPRNLEAAKVMKQTLLFLVVFNTTQWVTNSFIETGEKNIEKLDTFECNFFNETTWTLTMQVLQPFAIFFRFNSAFIALGAFLLCYPFEDN